MSRNGKHNGRGSPGGSGIQSSGNSSASPQETGTSHDASHDASHGAWPVRIGINPIVWSNDDFRDLGGNITLERCLAEMQQAGYAGSELGHKFPRRAETLTPLLDRFDLQLISGWHSLHLLERDLETEQRGYEKHLELLRRLGSEVVIVAECSRRIYADPTRPLHFDDRETLMSEADWRRLADGLERLAHRTQEYGMQMAYHHHMGTVVQSQREIDELMRRTRETRLLVDTGHLVFADVDPLAILRAHVGRVAHVHLKDVRPNVLMRARSELHSFAMAVRAGVFTVPGDGAIDFRSVFDHLHEGGYRGWLVVEAEQDPRRAQPLHYARMGLQHVQRLVASTAAEVSG